jgi:hypothetical protein
VCFCNKKNTLDQQMIYGFSLLVAQGALLLGTLVFFLQNSSFSLDHVSRLAFPARRPASPARRPAFS